MPVYTYRFDDGSEIDEIFLSWRDAPQELVVDGRGRARRVPARFSAHFPSLELRADSARGIVPYEPGMDRDIKRARQYQQEKEDRERRKALEEAMADIPL